MEHIFGMSCMFMLLWLMADTLRTKGDDEGNISNMLALYCVMVLSWSVMDWGETGTAFAAGGFAIFIIVVYGAQVRKAWQLEQLRKENE